MKNVVVKAANNMSIADLYVKNSLHSSLHSLLENASPLSDSPSESHQGPVTRVAL